MTMASNSATGPISALRNAACEALMLSAPDTGDEPLPTGVTAVSVHAVKAESATGHHLVLRLRRQRPEPVADHLRCTREKPVLMGIIGRPHNLVRANVISEHGNTVLDRLERNPAIALEQFARPHLRGGIVEALVVEMPVHAVEPGRNPAAARF